MTRTLLAALLLGTSVTGAMADPVCLMTNRINHTQATDDQHILFYMDDGKVWRNTLTERCVGLRMANGFSYEPTTPSYQICDNLVTIRTHDPVNVCMLGAFTPAPGRS